MLIRHICPHCGYSVDIEPQYAGQSGPCARCGRRITVSAAHPTRTAQEPPPGSRLTRLLVGLLIGTGLCLMLCTCGLLSSRLFNTTFRSAQKAVDMTTSRQNIQRIALALTAYRDDHGEYPPAYTVDDAGRPLHSWRVLILPYLGEEALYNAIKLDEPWTSAANQAVHARMPDVFAEPGLTAPTQNTAYVAIGGPGLIFDGSKKTRADEITDGLSETVLLVEVGSSEFHWMEPVDMKVDELDLAIGGSTSMIVSSNHSDGGFVALADGSVKFVPDTMDAAEFHSRLTIAGGEPQPLW